MRTALIGIGAAVLAAGAAAADETTASVDSADARARARLEHLAPFAVAHNNGWREDDPFTLSVFHQRSAPPSDPDARERWILRVESLNVETGGANSAAGPVGWAASDACPALARAIERFRLPTVRGLSDGTRPIVADDAIVVTAYDGPMMSLWAVLGDDDSFTRTEITLSSPPEDSAATRWVMRTREAVAPCLAAEAPVLADF